MTFTTIDDGDPPLKDEETITITVGDVNRPPNQGLIGNKAVDEDALLEFTVASSDPDGNNLTLSVSPLPTGATYTDHGDGTATFSWFTTYGDAGIYTMTFTTIDDGDPPLKDEETITITVGDDEDNDGIPNKVEMGPNGDNPILDGNDDTIPDCQQSKVASFHTFGKEYYWTLAFPYSLKDVAAIESAVPTPAGYEFPCQFIDFKVVGVPNGSEVTGKLIIHGKIDISTYWNYGPTLGDPNDHWYEFLRIGGVGEGVEISGSEITFHLKDGGMGDADLSVNGQIADQSGPAAKISNPQPADGGGGGGCFISSAW
jgi:hypothetical protein